MSLFKAIASGKEHRKPYHISARANGIWSMRCKSHKPGYECEWCRDNRIFNNKKREYFSLLDLKEVS